MLRRDPITNEDRTMIKRTTPKTPKRETFNVTSAQLADARPLAVRRKVAAKIIGIGTSKLDLMISDGTINALKAGKCLLILTSELERYLKTLPRAVINIKKRPSPQSANSARS
jgi:hypothetical protein